MSGMNRVVATCWTCLLLAAFLCEPVLSKGGRGGSRGSSRGTHRKSSAGSQRGSGPYGGTRSRVRSGGRSSPVRVAAAAAAGAAVAVALTADKWYASAYRRSNADSSEDVDYYNRTNYFDSQMSGSTKNGYSLPQLVSIIIATFSQRYGFFQDSIL